jgi:hypothetical protein
MIKPRRMRWAGHVPRMGRRGMHIGYWWESHKERDRRQRRRWVDNIKMDLREIGWGGMDWIVLVQEGDQWRALVNTVMNLRVPQNAGNFSSSCITSGFSRRAELHEGSQTRC